MTEIQSGQAYVAQKVIIGKNDQGPWEIIIVKAPGKAQPKIGISPAKVPSGIGPNGVFEVKEILSVMHRKMQSRVPTTWCEGSVTVRAVIRPLAKLTPIELEKVTYKEVQPEFPSLEDYFK